MQTLCIRDISSILNGLNPSKRALFDKGYINSEYIKHMDHLVDDSNALSEIKNLISDSSVLLLAPGRSLRNCTTEINKYKKDKNAFVISINFCPSNMPVDLVFVSNMKRFRSIEELSSIDFPKTVITSNISHDKLEGVLIVNYSSYLNEENYIADNAGLMCINLLKKIGVEKIVLAGFDGYSANVKENFYQESLCLDVEETRLVNMNITMAKKIKQLKNQIDISFIAESSYEKELVV